MTYSPYRGQGIRLSSITLGQSNSHDTRISTITKQHIITMFWGNNTMLEAIATIALFLTITSLVYTHVGIANIVNSYKLWFQEGYWVNYNVVEAISWIAKAAVILPGLIWQKEIWQLHVITLVTSALLIWVSERKLLPTMVAFNTLWIGLSSVVIVRNLL